MFGLLLISKISAPVQPGTALENPVPQEGNHVPQVGGRCARHKPQQPVTGVLYHLKKQRGQ